MKDLYNILGVEKSASIEHIKKTYRKLALSNHPDKGGDGEIFKLINEAYQTLSDVSEREKYDKDWEISNFSLENEDHDVLISGFLNTAGIHFSNTFRNQHESLTAQFRSSPLQEGDPSAQIKSFHTDLYSLGDISCSDIFSFIKMKTRGNPYHSVPLIDANSLTLEAAVDVFVKFLRGEYYGKSLRDLVRKFNIAIDNIAQNGVVSGHIQPLEGIRQIILMADNDTYQDDQLLNAILKITDYAKENVDQSIRYFAPLFQNKYFRNLYSQALHQYWLSGKSILDDDFLEKFNGHDKSAGYIDKIKEIMLKNREAGQSNDHLAGILRYVRLLNRLDKDINSDSGRDDTSLADFYRKKAYLILDWIPAIASTSGQSIIINTLLQAGVLFQKASSLEKVAAVRMADEKIALYVYLNAHKIGLRSTPDVEFYIYAHCLKFLSCARYVSPDLEDVFSAFQHRSLVIADIYPFFLTAQSNIDFQAQEDKSIILMRGLLHELNRIISINTSMAEEKDERPRVAIDHDYVKIFNQAYEACLKHWYEKKYNPETEKAFRIKLMQELLAVNRWTFLDLEFNLSAPWIMIKRDDQGWISPSRVLPFPDRVLPNNFSSIDGIEFDSNTGQIEFVFKKWKRGDATYKNLISIMDLSELFETKMSSAFFSLDPVDPDMPHHPFNKMRFGPPSVCQTQLFHTMLLTDYLLKFMTVGQEVQGQFPYGMKPIDDLTKNLPEYLKKIITDFHSSNHSEAMHRFWIEAQETVPVAVADEKLESTGISRYAVDDIKMVVKKHAMVYDINGNLVDKNEDDEGWGLYVLTESEKREFDLGRRVIEGPAIIFIMETNNLYFFDEDKLSNVFYLNYCDHHLYRLFNYPRNKDQRVILTQDSSHTIYRVTREAAKQSGRDHHYSPEYVFAREFTLHYNEFAMYFPEFGRLRELSKAMVLVGIMNRHREVNNHEIDRLNDLLKGNSDWKKIEQEIKTSVGDNLRREFSTWRDKFSKYKITKSCEESLNDVRRQVGSLTFSSSSPEISKIKNDWYEENKQSIISKHGYAAWNANSSKIWSDINSEVPSLIKKLSDQKYDNWRSELLRHFRDELAGYYNPQYLVECFLDGNDSPLLNELVKHNEGMIHKQIQKNFPKCSVSTIDSALNGSPQAINQIIDQMVKEEIERQKGVISAKISERLLLEKSFNKLGFGEVVDDPNLENICWWVPASISHDVEKGSSRFVYGGVRIAPQASFMQPNNPNGQMLLNQTFNGQNQGRVGSSDFGSAGGAGRQTLDHSAIKFSQSSVNGAQEITSSMRQNGWQGAPIDVVRMRDGSLIALDNTRVLAASRAGIKVEANVHNSNSRLSEDFSRRFSTVNGGTPKTWGEAVANRINKQSATYRNTYPMGSNIIGAKK